MAKVLFAWELGAGLGHILPNIPLINRLLDDGHSVYFALQDISHARLITDATSHSSHLHLLQGPMLRNNKRQNHSAISFADVLNMNGYQSVENLYCALKAWQSLLTLVAPDTLIASYSPTALLAARGRDIQRCQIGTGFFSPPKTSPLPAVRFWENHDKDSLAAQDMNIVETINIALAQTHNQPIENLCEIYAIDLDILTTYRELDHYPNREAAEYFGILQNHDYGSNPLWPDAKGRRIFAYLKPTPILPELLKTLNTMNHSVIVYCQGISEQFKGNYKHIHFSATPLNIAKIMKDTDLTITNANHDTLAASLLYGKSSLQFPITIEQLALSKRSDQIGATKTLSGKISAGNIAESIDELLHCPSYNIAAQVFATKYGASDQGMKINAILSKLNI